MFDVAAIFINPKVLTIFTRSMVIFNIRSFRQAATEIPVALVIIVDVIIGC